jgi:hypothetical protein
MGISLGTVLSGLVPLAEGAERGVDARKQLERQARQQLLAQRLQESEITRNYAEADKAKRAPAAGKLQHLVDPVTGAVYGYDPETNTVTPSTTAPSPAVPQQPQTPKPPAKIGVKPHEVVGYDAQGNALGITFQPGGGTPTSQAIPGAGRPLTPQERTAGSQAEAVGSSIDRLEQIAKANPQAVDQATAAIKAGHYGLPGRIFADVRNAFADPDAQEFYTLFNNYLLAVTPTYGGARPTQQLMDLEANASLPGLMAGGPARDAALTVMRHRLQDVRARAGRGALPLKDAPAKPAGGYKPKYSDNPY